MRVISQKKKSVDYISGLAGRAQTQEISYDCALVKSCFEYVRSFGSFS